MSFTHRFGQLTTFEEPVMSTATKMVYTALCRHSGLVLAQSRRSALGMVIESEVPQIHDKLYPFLKQALGVWSIRTTHGTPARKANGVEFEAQSPGSHTNPIAILERVGITDNNSLVDYVIKHGDSGWYYPRVAMNPQPMERDADLDVSLMLFRLFRWADRGYDAGRPLTDLKALTQKEVDYDTMLAYLFVGGGDYSESELAPSENTDKRLRYYGFVTRAIWSGASPTERYKGPLETLSLAAVAEFLPRYRKKINDIESHAEMAAWQTIFIGTERAMRNPQARQSVPTRILSVFPFQAKEDIRTSLSEDSTKFHSASHAVSVIPLMDLSRSKKKRAERESDPDDNTDDLEAAFEKMSTTRVFAKRARKNGDLLVSARDRRMVLPADVRSRLETLSYADAIQELSMVHAAMEQLAGEMTNLVSHGGANEHSAADAAQTNVVQSSMGMFRMMMECLSLRLQHLSESRDAQGRTRDTDRGFEHHRVILDRSAAGRLEHHTANLISLIPGDDQHIFIMSQKGVWGYRRASASGGAEVMMIMNTDVERPLSIKPGEGLFAPHAYHPKIMSSAGHLYASKKDSPHSLCDQLYKIASASEPADRVAFYTMKKDEASLRSPSLDWMLTVIHPWIPLAALARVPAAEIVELHKRLASLTTGSYTAAREMMRTAMRNSIMTALENGASGTDWDNDQVSYLSAQAMWLLALAQDLAVMSVSPPFTNPKMKTGKHDALAAISEFEAILTDDIPLTDPAELLAFSRACVTMASATLSHSGFVFNVVGFIP